jgi:hypothetical protein
LLISGGARFPQGEERSVKSKKSKDELLATKGLIESKTRKCEQAQQMMSGFVARTHYRICPRNRILLESPSLSRHQSALNFEVHPKPVK